MGDRLQRHSKPAVSLAFGLGSFMLMGDMALAVLRNGEDGGTIFDMGFPSIIGLIGFSLWVVAVILMVAMRIGRDEPRSARSRSVFLRGKDGFTCRSCKRYNKVVTGEYMKHHRCSCGAEYDLFQDGPWDEDGPMRRTSGASAGTKRRGTDRARRVMPPPPSR
ncbi:MAG: hypothetical protein MUC62_09200 [Candidatus Thermoplasmatota archaeon]|nr:hypothetical protein [Candidatus Thermoplasmatota archaeon]